MEEEKFQSKNLIHPSIDDYLLLKILRGTWQRPRNFLFYRGTWQRGNMAKGITVFYLTYIGSSPITITSSCPIGYSGLLVTGQTKCTEVWGDSIRARLEQCDDGNTASSDGCSNGCQIESDWICNNNNTAHQDACTKWAAGYEPNSTKDTWAVKETHRDIQNISYSIVVLTSIGLVWNISCLFLSTSTLQSSLAMINSIQLLLLLPLIGSYMSENFIGFIWAMKFALLSFDFLNEFKANYVKNLFEFEQNNSYLNLIGLESGSSGVNAYFIAGFSLQLISIFYIFNWDNVSQWSTRFYIK